MPCESYINVREGLINLYKRPKTEKKNYEYVRNTTMNPS